MDEFSSENRELEDVDSSDKGDAPGSTAEYYMRILEDLMHLHQAMSHLELRTGHFTGRPISRRNQIDEAILRAEDLAHTNPFRVLHDISSIVRQMEFHVEQTTDRLARKRRNNYTQDELDLKRGNVSYPGTVTVQDFATGSSIYSFAEILLPVLREAYQGANDGEIAKRLFQFLPLDIRLVEGFESPGEENGTMRDFYMAWLTMQKQPAMIQVQTKVLRDLYNAAEASITREDEQDAKEDNGSVERWRSRRSREKKSHDHNCYPQ